jgi:hypothetical protein
MSSQGDFFPWKDKVPWLGDPAVRPYLFMRKENLVSQPAPYLSSWFAGLSPLFIEALDTRHQAFGDAILFLENQAFGADLAMPRWVFYDCAVVPGMVCGFAIHRERIPSGWQFRLIGNMAKLEWVPISLFITIPTVFPGEWVAHNLCTVNSLLPSHEQFYALGFLTKAYGLWYGNVKKVMGMTQWHKPALKLHSHYGYLKVLTAYTPLHTHAQTMTYGCEIDPLVWEAFFHRREDQNFQTRFKKTSHTLNPLSENDMRRVQALIEQGGEFYLSPHQIAHKKIEEPYELYTPLS